MKVQVENLDSVRRKVEVLLPEETIAEIRDKIYEEVKKHAKIKGFRPGKMPKSIIMQYYKEYIDEEVQKKMVENTMFPALMEAKVEPITEPLVDFIEKDGLHGYTLECEVLPEVELPVYKGIEIETEPVQVSDEDVKGRIEGLQQMHAEIVAKPGDSVAEKGDFVVMKYQGYHNGEMLKEVASESYPVELGTSALMPEFENGVVGMKENEERDVEIPFPDDYPDKNIASKTLLFKITMKEIKQKRLPQINDDFAKDLSYENMEALKAATKEELLKEKEGLKNRDTTEKILDALMKNLTIVVPKRLLDKRVAGMIDEALSRYQPGRLSEADMKAIEERLRADFTTRAENRLKTEIVLHRIAEKEGITTSDKDVEERLKKIAEDANKTYNEMKGLYEQYNLMGGLKSSIVEEKTIAFLKENAVIKEKA